MALANFEKMGYDLEQQELESPGGVATPQLYSQLLAIYLLQNDTCNAKLLWKRIPQTIKSSNVELGHIWMVGQKMWQRDFPAIYESLKRDWPEPLKPIVAALNDYTRQRALALVSQAYSFIHADNLSIFVNMPTNEAIQAALAEGWIAEAHTKMIMPKKPGPRADPKLPNEQHLSVLTDYVSYLEN